MLAWVATMPWWLVATRKLVALAGADDDFRQVILKAAQVRAGKASRPEMP